MPEITRYKTLRKECDATVSLINQDIQENKIITVFCNSLLYKDYLSYALNKNNIESCFNIQKKDIDYETLAWIDIFKNGLNKKNFLKVTDLDKVRVLSYKRKEKDGEIESQIENIEKRIEKCQFEGEKKLSEIKEIFKDNFPCDISSLVSEKSYNYHDFLDYLKRVSLERVHKEIKTNGNVLIFDYTDFNLAPETDKTYCLGLVDSKYFQEKSSEIDFFKILRRKGIVCSYYAADPDTKVIIGKIKNLCFNDFKTVDAKPLDKLTFYPRKSREYDLKDLEIKPVLGDSIAITRISRYEDCPFAFWSSLLEKKRMPDLNSPLSMGSACHYLLNKFFTDIIEGRVSSNISETEIKELMKKYVNEEEFENFNLDKTTIENVISKTTETSVNSLKQIQNSDFKITYSEIRLGNQSQLKVRVPNGEEISLTGIIDRIDTYSDGKFTYFNVIDYKSGNDTFSYNKLQLGLYALSIQKTVANSVISGMYVQKISDNFKDLDKDVNTPTKLKGPSLENTVNHMDIAFASGASDSSDFIQAKRNKNGSLSKASEIYSQDDMQNIMDEEYKKAEEILTKIFEKEGKIAKRHDLCRNCRYNFICGTIV